MWTKEEEAVWLIVPTLHQNPIESILQCIFVVYIPMGKEFSTGSKANGLAATQ